eukprot:9032731-Lingulodinium_polyedra.AAC.1
MRRVGRWGNALVADSVAPYASAGQDRGEILPAKIHRPLALRGPASAGPTDRELQNARALGGLKRPADSIQKAKARHAQ